MVAIVISRCVARVVPEEVDGLAVLCELNEGRLGLRVVQAELVAMHRGAPLRRGDFGACGAVRRDGVQRVGVWHGGGDEPGGLAVLHCAVLPLVLSRAACKSCAHRLAMCWCQVEMFWTEASFPTKGCVVCSWGPAAPLRGATSRPVGGREGGTAPACRLSQRVVQLLVVQRCVSGLERAAQPPLVSL